MELKTLKDLEVRPCASQEIFCEIIKQEAIKHVIFLRKPANIMILDENCSHLEITILSNHRSLCQLCDSIIEDHRHIAPEDEPEVTFIKKFFNITEEDLE